MSTKYDDVLRQRLLEMIHGLLSDQETTELREQICSDPEIARAYSEVSIEAGVIAKAARLEAPKVELPKRRVTRGAAARSGPAAWMPWIVYVALSLLVAATLGGYVWDRSQRRDVAGDHMRLLVTGPATITPGVESRVTVRTESITGSPLPASIELSLMSLATDRKGAKQERQLLNSAERIRRSDTSGQPTEFIIPANLSASGPMRLEVLAHSGPSHPRFSRPLSIDPERFITQVSLDKPWYQPGETVYFRSLTLEGFSLSARREMPLEFEILDPAGSPVAGSKSQGVTERGVGNGSFALDAGLAGGSYTLVVRSLDAPAAFAEQKKEFLVQKYRLPRLKKELELTRDSYTPGDEVVADFAAQRAEGGPAAGAKLQITATVDGKSVFQKSETAAADGTFQVRFKLPAAIENGAGQLAVVVDDGGTRETAAKTIPINLGKLTVDFYPEGGDLVEGLSNRVYVAALDPAGELVHVEGDIVDSAGRAVASVTTVKDGRGSFTFTPIKGQNYQLKFRKPKNVKSIASLPSVNPLRPVVLTTAGGVFDAGAPLALAITAKQARLPLVVTATCRGTSVGQTTLITGEAGVMNVVTLPLAAAADGVTRVTVYDYSGPKPEPIAERLVFRRGTRKLNVALDSIHHAPRDASPHAEREGYYKFSPGQKAELKLKVTGERGRPVAATLGVAVVDDALLALAKEQTKHQPATMPTQFRLASEIEKPEQLEDVNFYLSDDSKAAEALDLLLGTQGWRRFASQRLDELVKNKSDDQTEWAALQGMLTASGPGGPPVVYDNLDEIRAPYERQLIDYETAQTDRRAMIGRAAFFGGAALLLGIAALGLVQLVRAPRVWVPAMTVATACLIVGGLWMGAPQRGPNGASAVAMFRADDTRPDRLVLTSATEEDVGGTTTGGGFGGGGFGGGAFGGFGAGGFDGNGFRGRKPAEAPAPDAVLDQGGAPPDAAARRIGKANDLKPANPIPAGDGEAGVQGEEAHLLQKIYPWNAADAIQEIESLRHQLRRALAGGDMAVAKELSEAIEQQLSAARFPVRQYAHRHPPGQPRVRTDFTETLYWNPLVIANAQGEATIRFDLSDAVTTFRVTADAQADAHSADGTTGLGRIGAGGGTIVSRIPFSLEPKLPLEVNAGDTIDLPVAVVNDTKDGMTVALKVEHDKLMTFISELSGGYDSRTIVRLPPDNGNPYTLSIDIKAATRKREFFPLIVTGLRGDAKLRFTGTAGALADTVERTIAVVPPGFPISASFSGRLDGPQAVSVKLQREWIPGSLVVSVQCYPTTLADLQAGLDSILQEPYGCFEQASMSNYPNVLTMGYMQEHGVADPAITRRARGLMKSGYAKLTGYECKQKGYEWFGGDPGHEALTAYGLLQFRDMAAVYDVDPAMVKRTANWLLARRDGKGGFERNARALDSFGGAPPDVTNAYIVWALTESGQKEIDKEVEFAVDLGRKSDDPYVIALSAATAINYKQEAAGRELLKKLSGRQQPDGHLTGTQSSITRSGGVSLDVETTALAALAWLKLPEFMPQANTGIDWILKSRQGTGGFGSTQATIMALKALVAHAKANRATVSGGELIVTREDPDAKPRALPGGSSNTEIARSKFTAGAKNAIEQTGLADKLQPGDNNLTLKLTGDNKMPYAVSVEYRTKTPVSQDACPVRLTTKLDQQKVAAGGTVALLATLTNTTDKGQPMTVAILGIPGGTRPRADQLEELKKNGTIDYFETRPREVVCYWRALAPKRSIDLRLDLIAEIPGRYTAPASRAYLYYTAEQKQWAEPVAIEIARE